MKKRSLSAQIRKCAKTVERSSNSIQDATSEIIVFHVHISCSNYYNRGRGNNYCSRGTYNSFGTREFFQLSQD